METVATGQGQVEIAKRGLHPAEDLNNYFFKYRGGLSNAADYLFLVYSVQSCEVELLVI